MDQSEQSQQQDTARENPVSPSADAPAPAAETSALEPRTPPNTNVVAADLADGVLIVEVAGAPAQATESAEPAEATEVAEPAAAGPAEDDVLADAVAIADAAEMPAESIDVDAPAESIDTDEPIALIEATDSTSPTEPTGAPASAEPATPAEALAIPASDIAAPATTVPVLTAPIAAVVAPTPASEAAPSEVADVPDTPDAQAAPIGSAEALAIPASDTAAAPAESPNAPESTAAAEVIEVAVSAEISTLDDGPTPTEMAASAEMTEIPGSAMVAEPITPAEIAAATEAAEISALDDGSDLATPVEIAEITDAAEIPEDAAPAPEPAGSAPTRASVLDDGEPDDGAPTEASPREPVEEPPAAPAASPLAGPPPSVPSRSRLPAWHVAAWHVAAWHLALPRLPRIPRKAVLLVMLVLIVALAGVGALEAVDALGQVRQARQLATDGIHHLEHAQALIDPSQPATLLDSATLTQAQGDLTAARRDFATLRATLSQPHGSLALGSHLPWAGSLLSSTAALAAAADEACQGGLALLEGGQLAANVAQGGVFASSAKPAPSTLPLNTDTFKRLRASLTTGWSHLERAIAYARQADLAALPSWLLKPSQQAQLRTLLARWPQLQDTYTQAQAVLDVLPTVLGLNGPSRYLIELMDRTELRAGGGFVGNYAVMTIQDGKVQPFTLTDTYLLDRPYLAKHPAGVAVPSQYSWWPWSDIFGLRDSNLSPDFPTTARLGMQQLTREGGPAVQGVIALTPAVIESVIHVIGPIPMPQYGQTVTEHNLEHLIHYYQEVPSHRASQTDLPPSDQISSTAKRFTALLGQAFMEKLHGLSLDKEIAIGKRMLDSLHVKDIQIYLSDSHAEALLAKYNVAGTLPHSPDDGVTVIDSNVTPSKGSQFMTILTKDAITLDANGTATHHVTITYQFNVTNPAELFGPDYYRSYLRVYAPATAQLIARQGLTNLGGHDQIGHSDLSGHQMWGGYVIIQNGHPYTLHFTWKVPRAATALADGRHAYTVVYSRQAGAQQRLDVTVSAPGKSAPAAKYAGSLLSNKALSVSY